MWSSSLLSKCKLDISSKGTAEFKDFSWRKFFFFSFVIETIECGTESSNY